MDRRVLGIALVLLSACSFGSGALFAKPVYAAGVDWLTLLSWRFLVGAALSWLWVLTSRRHRAALRAIPRRQVAAAVALGVLYVGNSATYYAAIETVSASLAALIVYVYPAIVAVLALFVGQRLAGTRAWAALALALAGVVLAVGGIDPATRPPIVGLVQAIASPLIYSVWIVLAARLIGERRETTGAGSDGGAAAAPATAVMMSATAATYWLVTTALGRAPVAVPIPIDAWPPLLAIGAVATFVAMQAFTAGARRIGAAQAALLSTIEPLWTITLAGLLLGEHLTGIQAVGGALILGGVLLSQATPELLRRRVRPVYRVADE
ncbi:MAG TPA: DMT family transporter [Candidatus Limnocylindrales bacterium]|nr:DMT family transporter [Candidatus Limnocylindrales bacterium]